MGDPDHPLCDSTSDSTAVSSSQLSTSSILPSLSDVIACQFSVWYPYFAKLAVPYKGRSNVTIKSVILSPLPPDFRAYLDSDRLILPHDTRTSSALLEAAADKRRNRSATTNDEDEWSNSSDDDDVLPTGGEMHSSQDSDDENDESSDGERTVFKFPELNRQIDTAIRTQLGGACLPKLNWSAPKDAVWINQGTMECRFAGDVYMLLKASDFCSHDLHHGVADVQENEDNQRGDRERFPTSAGTTAGKDDVSDRPSKGTTDFELQLVLRKWCTLYPSQEFRCFVRNRQLIAISQRHASQHYPHLRHQASTIQSMIVDFYTNVMNIVLTDGSSASLSPGNTCTLPAELQQLSGYVFDVYIDKKHRVWLIDINVWASRTDSLLFDWSELLSLTPSLPSSLHLQPTHCVNQEDEMGAVHTDPHVHSATEELEATALERPLSLPLLRLVETEKQVQNDPLSSYRAPIDTLHVVGGGGDGSNDLAASKFFTEFMAQCERP